MSPDQEGRSGRPEKPNPPRAARGTKDPRYISLRPGALAVTQLPAYSFEVEQYRNLSLQIEERFDPEDQGSHVLAIVGPDPSSGKTLTSLNLALIFSKRSERKVLLVEGDLWKPSFGSVFQLQAETVGMSDLLGNEQLHLDDALFPVWGTALSVLTAGQRAVDGDLVTSRRMDDLVVAMKSKFDLVIFDTPPFGLASGRYLTRYADSVLVVARAGKTRRNSIEATLDGLDAKTVVGLVLNDVRKRKRNYAYYTAYTAYYGGEYGGEPRGWFKGFWKRPLAGLATVTGVLGVVAASVFAILKGKSAEAEIQPAWIVAGALLILTVISWAVAIGMRQPLQDRREPAELSEFAGRAAAAERIAALAEGDPVVVSMPVRGRSDPGEEEDIEALEDGEELPSTIADTAKPGSDSAPADHGITIANLNIRRHPALDGERLATLPRGTPFELLERADDWYLVRAGEQVGWVAKLGTQLEGDGGSAEESKATSGIRAVATPRAAAGRPHANTNLNLRSEPGREGRYLSTLPEGTLLEVFEQTGEWYRVRAGELSGWVFGPGVDEAPEVPIRERAPVLAPDVAPDGPRTNTNLNLRAEPGRQGLYMTTLPAGTPLEILEERGDWYRVRAGDQSGWVFGPGVDGAPDLPVDEPKASVGLQDSQHQFQVGFVPPRFLHWQPPAYQTTVDSKGLGETIVATVGVAATGSVVSVALAEESKTDASFERAVLESLRRASFRPAFRNGKAVAAKHQVRVEYRESK